MKMKFNFQHLLSTFSTWRRIKDEVLKKINAESYILLGVLATFLLSCNDAANDKKNVLSQSKYVDVKSFFEEEISRLNHTNNMLEKTLLFDGKSEVNTSVKPNWNKELEAFLELDLLKNIYTGRLISDSVFLDNKQLEINYTSNDSSVDLKHLQVVMLDNKITSVVAKFTKQNNLYQSIKEYHYYRDSLYSIKGNQKVKLLHSPSYSVIGKIIK